MFEDTTHTSAPTKKGRKKASSSTQKRLSSSSNNTNESSDGESGSLKDEQMVPNVRPITQVRPMSQLAAEPIRSEFAFSDLMRKMASKYQPPSDAAPE